MSLSILARVIGVRGQRYAVRTETDDILECLAHKQQPRCCCGDCIEVQLRDAGQCQLETLLPRQSLLSRADPFKTKMIAANLTQVAIITAVEPGFSNELITRILVACTIEQIRPIIILNKVDIIDALPDIRAKLHPFSALGYPIIETCALDSVDVLLPYLYGQVTLFIGQSGMGKSTLLNAVAPDANALTQEISTALDSGRHTTTASTWYDIDAHTAIIDSPGLQAFGLYHYTRTQIEQAFGEFRTYLGQCRFDDCNHQEEPDCALRAALDCGHIFAERWTAYHQIIQENAYRHNVRKSKR